MKVLNGSSRYLCVVNKGFHVLISAVDPNDYRSNVCSREGGDGMSCSDRVFGDMKGGILEILTASSFLRL